MNDEQLKRYLAELCRKVGGQAAWAQGNDVSPGYVSDVLNGRKEPGEKLLAAMKVEKLPSRYRKIP